MARLFAEAKRIFFEILFPPVCAACSKITHGDEPLCAPCLAEIPIATALSCPTCGSRLANGAKKCHPSQPFTLAAASRYNAPHVRSLILKLKYGRTSAVAPALAHLLILHAQLLKLQLKNFFVIPIPLHRSRERARGFNQADLIAVRFAAHLNLRYEPRALKRIRPTLPQTETENAAERRRNLAGSFAVMSRGTIRNLTIILVDDVLTTGATMSAAARALREAGARRVIAFVVAQA